MGRRARVVRTASPPGRAAQIGHRLRGAGLQLAQRRAGHRGGGGGDLVVLLLLLLLLLLLEVQVVVRSGGGGGDGACDRLLQVDVTGRLGEVALGLDEARLQVDDVVAELVVLRLDGLVVLVQQVVVAHLLLQFLDVAFFALPERSLLARRISQMLVSWLCFWASLSFWQPRENKLDSDTSVSDRSRQQQQQQQQKKTISRR